MTAQIIQFPAPHRRWVDELVSRLEQILASPRSDQERELAGRLDARCQEMSGEGA